MSIAFLAWFDVDRLRPTVERLASERLQREVKADHLRLEWRRQPRIIVENLHLANPEGFEPGTFARVGNLAFTVSIGEALRGRLLLPTVALHDADVRLERRADGRASWTLEEAADDPGKRDSDEKDPPPIVRVSTLSIDQGRLRLNDRQAKLDLDLRFDTVDRLTVTDDGEALRTQLRFNGHYQQAAFEGEALVGDVLTLQQSGQFFPLRGRLHAGTTKLTVNGRVSDLAALSGIDVQLRIEGQTLGNLYPFLLLPLPATPPYEIAGRLKFEDGRYDLSELAGRIGSTDISGTARYLQAERRPRLEADLHSRQLVMADLGPLIGVETKESGGKPRIDQRRTATRERAAAADRSQSPNRLLPAGRFDPERLKAIDADIKLKAAHLKLNDKLPLETLDAALRLDEGVLQLEPFRFGFAGGVIDAKAQIDGRKLPLGSTVSIDVRQLKIARLLPESSSLAQGAGTLSGRMTLRGHGDSIAQAASKADGTLAALVTGGRISNLLDAAAGLNGGKVLTLLLGGDQEIALRCGAASFDVRKGVGVAKTFVIDTEQTQIVGEGGFNLDTERFDLKVTPLPKSAGILSMRTPLHLHGAFRDPDYRLEKMPLAARIGGALALAAVAPPAALLALIETGPGESTDCAQMLREARQAMAGQRPAAPAGRAAPR